MRIASAALVAMTAGCGNRESAGFSLPEGDTALGKAAFASYGCGSCHFISGFDDLRKGLQPEVDLEIGGR